MEGEKKTINQALWLECAGPLITLPAIGSQVVYFPQGHSEQVIASTQKEVDPEIPSYPNLPPQLYCQLHNITLHADQENDEVFAQMTLQPLQQTAQVKDPFLLPDLGIQPKQAIISFSKTLTASDTSTHGGFSIPRRAAEKVFPPLDFTKTPPAQELVARDLHNNEWHFRHIYRGQPRRHLLTTGWSVFVSAKRLQAGDTVLFIRDEQGQLMLGIRRANRQQANLPTSLLSSDSMLIGVLAAAAHAASTNSRFTIFYNPRASPSEFVIPLAKYQKALHPPQVTVGMRFRMEMETEDSSTRRYMGTITGIGDLDPVRWPNSHWRSLKVGWDESTAGQRQRRVSAWEIEPLTAPFLLCNSSFLLRSKRLRPNEEEMDMKRPSIWARGEEGKFNMQSLSFPGLGMDNWLRLQQKPEGAASAMQPGYYSSMAAAALEEMRNGDPSKQHQGPSVNQFQQMQFGGLVPPILQSQHQAGQNQQQMMQLPNISEPPLQPSPNLQASYNLPGSLKTSSILGDADVNRNGMGAGSFSLQNILNRQNPDSLIVEDNVSYSSMLQNSNQGPLQKQTGLLTCSSLVNQDQTPTGSWMSSLRDASHMDAQSVANLQMDAASMSLPRIEPTNQGGIPPLPSQSGMPSQQSQLVFRENQDQEGDRGSHLLFGVNIDGRLGIPNENPPFTSPTFSKVKDVQGQFTGGSVLAGSSSSTGADVPMSNGMMMNGGTDENGVLQQNWPQVYPPPVRTFTKVHKVGSVGRSLDMTRFKNYNELVFELGRMFGLEGQLDQKSGWQVVFIDNENDMLLLGDDPWEEFISCVRSIRILSPSEVQQMNQEQLDWLSSIPVSQQQQRQTSSSSEDCIARQDSRISAGHDAHNNLATVSMPPMPRNPGTLSSNYSDPSCVSDGI